MGARLVMNATAVTTPLGPLGCECSQHRQTLRPSVDAAQNVTIDVLCSDDTGLGVVISVHVVIKITAQVLM